MLDILAITSPIYIIILLGYLFTYFGVFAKVEMRVFGKFVLNLALPALLFKTLAQRSIEIASVRSSSSPWGWVGRFSVLLMVFSRGKLIVWKVVFRWV